MGINVIIAGDSNVGKSSIMRRFKYDTFTECSDNKIRQEIFTIDDKDIIIRDISKFKHSEIVSNSSENISLAFIVVDFTNLYSVVIARTWKYFLSSISVSFPVILLVNKFDQNNDNSKTFQDYAKEDGYYTYFAVSAKTGYNIKTVWKEMCNLIEIPAAKTNDLFSEYIESVISNIKEGSADNEIFDSLAYKHAKIHFFPEYEQFRTIIHNDSSKFELVDSIDNILINDDENIRKKILIAILKSGKKLSSKKI